LNCLAEGWNAAEIAGFTWIGVFGFLYSPFFIPGTAVPFPKIEMRHKSNPEAETACILYQLC